MSIDGGLWQAGKVERRFSATVRVKQIGNQNEAKGMAARPEAAPGRKKQGALVKRCKSQPKFVGPVSNVEFNALYTLTNPGYRIRH